MSLDRKTLLQTGLATSSASARTPSRSFTCRVVLSDGSEQTAPMGGRPLVLGAGGDSGLILKDDQVSRRHVACTVIDGGVRVHDLGSTNGTFWQGARVSDVVVPLGSSIRVGSCLVHFNSAEVPSIPPSERLRFGGLVGSSIAMRELFAVLELASPSEATILIDGESGTGKEVTARAIHDHSPRASVPLVVVDCSAISEQLIESHLFGHVKGAFTGAQAERKGAFVEASGGTVFLDEIGELPLSAQAKLLRVLEAQTVQPVGSDRPVEVDTRVVAATHRNLAKMVEEKKFRFDLFYRIAVVHAHIPPLRERPEDIAPLVAHFYEGRGVEPGPIDGANLERLMQHSWPGNVRELRNVLERAWALSGPAGAAFRDLRLWMQSAGTQNRSGGVVDVSLPFKEAKERWVGEFEQRYLAKVFETHGRNITHASEHAGINRRHFRTLLKKHGIINE